VSYQVLARKYRPKTFEEVVGQQHVTVTLTNAIKKNRIHHAYLFTGVRGTGKTSLARIFAKALNCETGPTATPCNRCAHCTAIDKGQFLDVHEIDGASNTSVDNVRELREQVKYLPAAGRYKIYIIDEVHMLSTSAFNALLKTLEEPPPHVLFIFATTEAHKIPTTILSRCQRFDLRRLQPELLRERLELICRAEKIKYDSPSLEALARASEGSMRDAQSLLDMAIGTCGDTLRLETIREMLGQVEGSWIQALSADCLAGRAAQALRRVQEIYDRGLDLRQVAMQWVEYLHDVAVLKAAGPEALGAAYDATQLDPMKHLAATTDLASLQIAFQTVYRAAEQIFRSDSPKILFDLLVVKLIHGSPFQDVGDLLAGTSATDGPKGPHYGESIQAPVVSPFRGDFGPQGREIRDSKSEIRNSPPDPALDRNVLDQALHKHPQIKAVLDHALSTHLDGGLLTVTFEKGALWVEMFQEKRETLAQLLSEQLGSPVHVMVREREKIREVGASPAVENNVPDDPVVRQAVEILNAKVKEVKRS
jgi:DNA polymerase-3 subunit gamma/tau